MLYDDLNRFMVRGIFWEMANPDQREQHPPLFTLKMESFKGLPSAYETYMGSVDEYEAAHKIAGNMKNWRKLCNCKWFMDGVIECGHEGLKQWRKDMEARDKSLAKRQLQEKAEEGSVQAMSKLYGMSATKVDNRKKTKPKRSTTTQDRIIDIAKRIK